MAEVVVVNESIGSILWLLYGASVPGSYSLPAPRCRLDVPAHESEGSAFGKLFPAGASLLQQCRLSVAAYESNGSAFREVILFRLLAVALM